ncbi:MAG: hypothetical protein JNM00_00090 [Flavobacteriales bacterium]|nr:hypothetical protein [Flavobacteriales bacterium]
MWRYLSILACFIPSWSMGQDQATMALFGGEFSDYGADMLACQNGGFLSAGTTSSVNGLNTDIYVVKVDESLNCVWNLVLGTEQTDWVVAVAEDAFNNYYVCGVTAGLGEGGYDVIVYRINSDGEIIWQKTFGGEDWDFANEIEINNNGNLFIGGSTYNNGNGNADAWLIELDAFGNIQSEMFFGEEGYDEINALYAFEDGVLVGGAMEFEDGKHAFLGLLAEDGEWNWFREFEKEECRFHDIIANENRIFYVFQFTTALGYLCSSIGAVDFDGQDLWIQADEVPGDYVINSLALEGSNLVISGYTNYFGTGTDNGYLARRTINGNFVEGITLGAIQMQFHEVLIYLGEVYTTGWVEYEEETLGVDMCIFRYPDVTMSPDAQTTILMTGCLSNSIAENQTGVAGLMTTRYFDLMGREVDCPHCYTPGSEGSYLVFDHLTNQIIVCRRQID